MSYEQKVSGFIGNSLEFIYSIILIHVLFSFQWMTPAEGASKFIARQIKIGMPQVYELLRFSRWATGINHFLLEMFTNTLKVTFT